ncbi:MAG: heme-binding protein [Pseudomonadota bacterium]
MKNLVAACCLILAAAPLMAAEEPDYRVLAQREGYELRQYEAYLVAETDVPGSQRSGGNQAFRVLAGYIFGKNQSQEKMAMTIPVTAQLDEEASQEGQPIYHWQFVMERKYRREDLPTPLDNRVRVREIPPRLVAARRYSGSTGERNFLKNLQALEKALARDGVMPAGQPLAAVYNGPLTPGFLRRNEVLVEVAPAAEDGQTTAARSR